MLDTHLTVLPSINEKTRKVGCRGTRMCARCMAWLREFGMPTGRCVPRLTARRRPRDACSKPATRHIPRARRRKDAETQLHQSRADQPVRAPIHSEPPRDELRVRRPSAQVGQGQVSGRPVLDGPPRAAPWAVCLARTWPADGGWSAVTGPRADCRAHVCLPADILVHTAARTSRAEPNSGAPTANGNAPNFMRRGTASIAKTVGLLGS